MSTEQVKTFKLTPKHAGVAEMRARIASAAEASEVRLLSVDESRGRFSTKLEVTVAGHPSQVRKFHDELYPGSGTSGGGLDAVAIDMAVELVIDPLAKRARERWHRRREPPLRKHVPPGAGEARTTVTWKWERMLPNGDAVGPVRVSTYLDGQAQPTAAEDWPQWVKRSEALAYAQEHGFVFEPQDLPDE